MKKALVSPAFAGEVIFEFDDVTGLLLGYNLADAGLSEAQQRYILQNLPRHIEQLGLLVEESKTASIADIKEEVTFEAFWVRYDDRVASSKKRAEAKWEKMSQIERSRAYKHISTYFRSLPQGTRKKYAETYLNAELWNN